MTYTETLKLSRLQDQPIKCEIRDGRLEWYTVTHYNLNPVKEAMGFKSHGSLSDKEDTEI